MLCIVTAGLPVTAKEILVRVSSEVFGDGGAELVTLDADTLRMRVRMSQRNPSDVLVVLDSVSSDKCKDIENGLYTSDKYLEYSSDEGLVKFLNNKFGLSLEVPSQDKMEFTNEYSSGYEEVVDRLKAQLLDQEDLIESMQERIAELTGSGSAPTGTLDDGELEKLRTENLNLRNQILEIQSSAKDFEGKVFFLEKERDRLSENLENLNSRQNQLLADYKSVSGELSDYKVKYSTQTVLLNSKDAEIESMKAQLLGETELKQKLKMVEDEKSIVEKHLKETNVESSQLRVDLSSKVAEIARLKDLLENGGMTSDERKAIEDKLSESEGRVAELEKSVVEWEGRYDAVLGEKDAMEGSYSSLQEELNSVKGKLSDTEDRLKKSDETLMEMNTELIRAKSTAEMLEKSTSRDTDVEGMYREIAELQSKLDSITSGVFGKLSGFASPRTSLAIRLLHNTEKYDKLRFVFSGSTESRKGTYRCLLDEFRGLPNSERVVIVDVTSETCVDYVFEIKSVVPGLNWFIKGGGVQQYLSKTCLSNVQVLSPGLGYINDCYFLTVNWDDRLRELNESGYNVVVYLGDVSSMTGRVFHEAFASCGSSMVYVHGNAIGARSVVSNLKGLSNAKDSVICYFEYNKKVERFYNMVAKTNECRVLSML